MIHVPLATEKAEFFAGEGQEENSSFRFGLMRRPAGEFDYARGSRGVVVGAGMDGPDLRRRERILIPQAQMVVMRADDDVFVGFAGEVGGDVVRGFGFGADVDR